MARSYEDLMGEAKQTLARPAPFTPAPKAPPYKPVQVIAHGREMPKRAPMPRNTLADRLSQEQALEGGRGQGIFRARTYGTTKP